MKLWVFILFCLFIFSGCVPLLIGVGAVGGYAISKDTLQAEIDARFSDTYRASEDVLLEMDAEMKYQDSHAGRLEASLSGSLVKIRIESLTDSAQRIRVSARKMFLPDMNLANRILVKIIKKLK